MAKTMKSAPKRSVSANSKKSSKGFLGKKFNLQSRKVQFFVVILIVAVLGGGYYTYKSFAATGVASYTGKDVIYSQDADCSVTYVTNYTQDKAKNNNDVLYIQGNNTCAKSKFAPYASHKDKYKVCANVRGSGTIQFPGYPNQNLLPSIIPSETTYNLVCSGWVYREPFREQIKIKHFGNGRIYVGALSLERQGVPDDGSYGGTPAK